MKRLAICLCSLLCSCAGLEPGVQQQGRAEALERGVRNLRAELQTLQRRLQWLEPGGEAGLQVTCVFPSIPLIVGNVVAIASDPRLVFLDRGSADGVVAGHVFSIFKERTFKGQARILQAESHRSVAVVIGEKNPIVVGDSASTGI